MEEIYCQAFLGVAHAAILHATAKKWNFLNCDRRNFGWTIDISGTGRYRIGQFHDYKRNCALSFTIRT